MERIASSGNLDPKLYSTGEAASILGISQQAIIRGIDGKVIAGFKIPAPSPGMVGSGDKKTTNLERRMTRHSVIEQQNAMEQTPFTPDVRIVVIGNPETLKPKLQTLMGQTLDNVTILFSDQLGPDEAFALMHERPESYLIDKRRADAHNVATLRRYANDVRVCESESAILAEILKQKFLLAHVLLESGEHIPPRLLRQPGGVATVSAEDLYTALEIDAKNMRNEEGEPAITPSPVAIA